MRLKLSADVLQIKLSGGRKAFFFYEKPEEASTSNIKKKGVQAGGHSNWNYCGYDYVYVYSSNHHDPKTV
jgi:hypothetical protein